MKKKKRVKLVTRVLILRWGAHLAAYHPCYSLFSFSLDDEVEGGFLMVVVKSSRIHARHWVIFKA